jgi:hypothetical protein
LVKTRQNKLPLDELYNTSLNEFSAERSPLRQFLSIANNGFRSGESSSTRSMLNTNQHVFLSEPGSTARYQELPLDSVKPPILDLAIRKTKASKIFNDNTCAVKYFQGKTMSLSRRLEVGGETLATNTGEGVGLLINPTNNCSKHTALYALKPLNTSSVVDSDSISCGKLKFQYIFNEKIVLHKAIQTSYMVEYPVFSIEFNNTSTNKIGVCNNTQVRSKIFYSNNSPQYCTIKPKVFKANSANKRELICHTKSITSISTNLINKSAVITTTDSTRNAALTKNNIKTNTTQLPLSSSLIDYLTKNGVLSELKLIENTDDFSQVDSLNNMVIFNSSPRVSDIGDLTPPLIRTVRNKSTISSMYKNDIGDLLNEFNLGDIVINSVGSYSNSTNALVYIPESSLINRIDTESANLEEKNNIPVTLVGSKYTALSDDNPNFDELVDISDDISNNQLDTTESPNNDWGNQLSSTTPPTPEKDTFKKIASILYQNINNISGTTAPSQSNGYFIETDEHFREIESDIVTENPFTTDF